MNYNLYSTLSIILFTKCSPFTTATQSEIVRNSYKSNRYKKTLSEFKEEIIANNRYTIECPIDLRIESKKLADLPLNLSSKPQYEEKKIQTYQSKISTVASEQLINSKNTALNVSDKRKRTDTLKKEDLEGVEASKRLKKGRGKNLKPDIEIKLDFVNKPPENTRKDNFTEIKLSSSNVPCEEIIKIQDGAKCDIITEKVTKYSVGIMNAEGKHHILSCEGLLNVKYFCIYGFQLHKISKKEAVTVCIKSSFEEFFESEMLRTEKSNNRTDPISSYEQLKKYVLKNILNLKHIENFKCYHDELNYTCTLKRLKMFLAKIGGREVVNVKNNKEVDPTFALISSSKGTRYLPLKKSSKDDSSHNLKQSFHATKQKDRIPFFRIDKDLLDGISYTKQKKQAAFVCLKANIEEVIFKEEGSALFFEMPELIFYIEWRLQCDYFDQNEKVCDDEIRLIKNVLNSYSKSEDTFLRNILFLRLYIKNRLKKHKEKCSPQYHLYNYAMQIPEKLEGHILRNRHKIRFMFFLLSFTMNPGADFLKILENGNGETKKQGYKGEPTYLYRKRLLTIKEPISDIALTIQIILRYLQSRKKISIKKKIDAVILYAFSRHAMIISECDICQNFTITVTTNTEIANIFYDKILRLMKRY